MTKPVFINKKIKNFKKKITISGDKSLSIRWALMASQAMGKSKAYNLLNSEDVLSTIKCLKKLVIALTLLGNPKVLLLDECFAALDVLTIKMLQELIVNLQTESNISICICDHQARDLLSCVDVAIVISNCKIIAKGTPSKLVKDKNAKSAYFGDSFKFN